jgi:hypothetical protein
VGIRDVFALDHFWEDFFGGYKERKEREKQEAVAQQVFQVAKQVLPEAVKTGALEVASSAVIIALLSGSGVDTRFLTQHQIEQLEKWTESMLVQRQQETSKLLDESTRYHGSRKRESGQQ